MEEQYKIYLDNVLRRIFFPYEYDNDNLYINNLKGVKRSVPVSMPKFKTYSKASNHGLLSEGLIWKKRSNSYYDNTFEYFDENGEKVLELGKGVICVSDFHDGLASVMDVFSHVIYINKKGEKVIDLGKVAGAGNFENGFTWFTPDNRRFYFLDKNGNKSKKFYQEVWAFNDGYAVVRLGPLYNVVNEKFEEIGNWENRIPRIRKTNNFEFINDKMRVAKNYITDYEVKKTLFGYECTKEDRKINVRCLPVKIYYDRFVLCVDNKCNMFLFDNEKKSYTKVDSAKWVEFDDNFILSKNHFFGTNNDCFVVYFVYDGGIVDITEFYNRHLNERNSFNITPNLGKIMTYNEFLHQDDKFMKEDEIQDIIGEDTMHRRRY